MDTKTTVPAVSTTAEQAAQSLYDQGARIWLLSGADPLMEFRDQTGEFTLLSKMEDAPLHVPAVSLREIGYTLLGLTAKGSDAREENEPFAGLSPLDM